MSVGYINEHQQGQSQCCSSPCEVQLGAESNKKAAANHRSRAYQRNEHHLHSNSYDKRLDESRRCGRLDLELKINMNGHLSVPVAGDDAYLKAENHCEAKLHTATQPVDCCFSVLVAMAKMNILRIASKVLWTARHECCATGQLCMHDKGNKSGANTI